MTRFDSFELRMFYSGNRRPLFQKML